MGRSMVHGVGVNDADYQVGRCERAGGSYKTVWACPVYTAWSRMIQRCYSRKSLERHPTYFGCTVAPEWHSFMAFREWMITQDHEGKDLDKDILIPGNKVYSPDTCVFVGQELNKFLVDCGASRGEWPVGVYWNKKLGKFQASCRNPFTRKNEHLGLFVDPMSGHEAWRRRKHQHACAYADMQTDQRISQALRNRFDTTRIMR